MSPAPAHTAHDISSRALAWLHTNRAPLPLHPALLTEHTSLTSGGNRTILDTAIARRPLGLETA
ncbi:hypothetical protein DMH15_37500 [Streptomyces sp. WAC 06725]|uniref:hypothetical protein n=1 Tax=Streptomyces sp. WAC 06725 TaxID=2203209 RepID=UPI000F7496D8|nr:hypothetical protein [Streptomyces sp. WAC 06725]RSO17306.1 hypothetical protein DMH15_37500 [Streptomyces sp. WAC 06725]